MTKQGRSGPDSSGRPPESGFDWDAYLERCRRAKEEAPGDHIDLSPEEEAAIDAVWERRDRERERDRAQQSPAEGEG